MAESDGDLGVAAGAEGAILETDQGLYRQFLSPVVRRGTMTAVEEIVVDCPACAEPFALQVDVEAEEQSHFLSCPSCAQALEIFVRCEAGEVLSSSVSVD